MKAEDLGTYQPLVNYEDEAEATHEALVTQFKLYSLLIGGACGIFVQLSTLGANSLLVSFWGYESLATLSPKQAMLFSLSWSFFTSCMALLVLALLRGMISTVLATNTGHAEKDMLIMAMEVRYVVGALTGVCVSWACTDLLLGLQSLAFYSLATLVIALVWSRITIALFATRSGERIEEDSNELEPKIEATSIHVV
jgi:hypothetical protein